MYIFKLFIWSTFFGFFYENAGIIFFISQCRRGPNYIYKPANNRIWFIMFYDNSFLCLIFKSMFIKLPLPFLNSFQWLLHCKNVVVFKIQSFHYQGGFKLKTLYSIVMPTYPWPNNLFISCET